MKLFFWPFFETIRLKPFVFRENSAVLVFDNGPSHNDLFRTCNVLPFSCTHLAWCKTKLIGQQNGRKTPIHEILYHLRQNGLF
jgi:hypothetical protein